MVRILPVHIHTVYIVYKCFFESEAIKSSFSTHKDKRIIVLLKALPHDNVLDSLFKLTKSLMSKLLIKCICLINLLLHD